MSTAAPAPDPGKEEQQTTRAHLKRNEKAMQQWQQWQQWRRRLQVAAAAGEHTEREPAKREGSSGGWVRGRQGGGGKETAEMVIVAGAGGGGSEHAPIYVRVLMCSSTVSHPAGDPTHVRAPGRRGWSACKKLAISA